MQSEDVPLKALVFDTDGGVVGLKWNSDIALHGANAYVPMLVTLLGMTSDVRL